MPRRAYFTKAKKANRDRALSKPARVSTISHNRKGVVHVTLRTGESRLLGSGKARLLSGASRGGVVAQAKGKGHRFDSESGKAATLKAWRKTPVNPRLGYRLGRKLRYRPRVNHAAMREKHSVLNAELFPANQELRGVYWSPSLKVWAISDDQGTRTISERTALKRLGYLRDDRTSGLVPREGFTDSGSMNYPPG